jgi:hypothetical protein
MVWFVCFAPHFYDAARSARVEADEHHERDERDEPFVALGRAVRDEKHAALRTGKRRGPGKNDRGELLTLKPGIREHNLP